MAEHFHALRVAEIVPETDDALSIRFEVPPELADAFRFKAGQHLTLKADIGDEEVRRNYSLCTAPDEGEIKVCDWSSDVCSSDLHENARPPYQRALG